MKGILSVEGAVEKFRNSQIIEIFILSISHLLLDLFSLIKLACFEGGSTLFEQALQAIVVKCKLNVSYFIHVLGYALVSVLLHEPFLDFMAQILFKLHYAVLIGNIFLLKELHVLFTGNLV